MAARVLAYSTNVTEGDEEDDQLRNYENEIVRQIDELQKTVEVERDGILGKDWMERIDEKYNLTEGYSPAPTFRPKILVPEMQIDMLHEASDLSDLAPIPYIIKKDQSKRDEEREQAFVANWKQCDYNLDVLMATIWALFAGTSYLEVSWDPDADNGQGRVNVTARDPSTVARDPYALRDEDAKFWVFEDMMYIDEVRARWPEQGHRIKHKRAGSPTTSSVPRRLTLPDGPMSETGGPIGETSPRPFAPADTRVRVRKLFVEDYSFRELRDVKTGKVKRQRLYPKGRMIIECEGIVLVDKQNPIPLGIFPGVSIHGMPPLNSHFAPPATKYTNDLQELAEKMLTQTFENAVRVNNAVVFIDEGSGIDLEEFGGVPGEAHEIAQGTKPPEFKWPNPLPQHMVDLPKMLLELGKELRGMTPARKGVTQAGNVSSPLFDSALMQSQSLTRLRSRLLAKPYQRLAKIVFVFMARFFNQERLFLSFSDQELQSIKWEGVDADEIMDYFIQLDEDSILPYSQTVLRGMVPILKQLGIIDPETAMDFLGIPNKERVLQRLQKMAEVQAQIDEKKAAAKGAKGKK